MVLFESIRLERNMRFCFYSFPIRFIAKQGNKTCFIHFEPNKFCFIFASNWISRRILQEDWERKVVEGKRGCEKRGRSQIIRECLVLYNTLNTLGAFWMYSYHMLLRQMCNNEKMKMYMYKEIIAVNIWIFPIHVFSLYVQLYINTGSN